MTPIQRRLAVLAFATTACGTRADRAIEADEPLSELAARHGVELEPTAFPPLVSLPARANGWVDLSTPELTVRFRIPTLTPAPAARMGQFLEAAPGGGAFVLRGRDNGIEDYVELQSPPPSP